MRQQMAPPHDAFDLRAASGPTAADGRSKSVSNLQQPDPARAYPPHSGADTLPRGAQRHPGAAHLSQPDLRRDPTGPPGDYENYPRNNMAPQQQPDYVNQRDLRAQGSQSMHNLRGKNEQPMMQGAPRNDMRPTGPQGLPPGQAGAYHSLQRALDPQSTLRGQKLNPRASQEVRMGAPASPQQPPNMPQQFAPPHSQHGYPAPGFPGMQSAPRPMQAPPNATYQNFPVSSSAQNRFALPHQMGDPRMRANTSPDFPPPPDINPPLPEVPPPDDARNDSLPPPPPSDHTLPRNATAFNQYDSHAPGSAGLAYGQQNYQNLPPVSRHADMMYSQAPSHSGPQGGGTLNRNQSQSAGTLPRAPGAPSGQPIRPPAPATQAGKRPPPIAAKPKLNLAEIRKGFTQSPWEREEKEREVRRREEEKRLMRDHEISELERREHLSHEEQERLRRCTMCTLDNSNISGVTLTVHVLQCFCSARLQLDREFDKRVTEVDARPGNDDDDDEITPSARVKMLRHMQEDLERKRVQEDEDRKRSELARQAAEERERQERYESTVHRVCLSYQSVWSACAHRVFREQRRLQQIEDERQAEKMRQQKLQQQREMERQEAARKQRVR